VNYCDAGEWIAFGYLHKTSFARHPWAVRHVYKSSWTFEGNATDITPSPGLLMTFSPRSGDPDVLHSQAWVT